MTSLSARAEDCACRSLVAGSTGLHAVCSDCLLQLATHGTCGAFLVYQIDSSDASRYNISIHRAVAQYYLGVVEIAEVAVGEAPPQDCMLDVAAASAP
jgi:hypothetical protein